jgi:putative ABC transport system substrate-binding protein
LLLAVSVFAARSTTLAAERPPPDAKRIGWLSAGHPPSGIAAYRDVLRQALVGYVRQQQVTFEERDAAGRLERLPALASDLVRLKASVILAAGNEAVRAAKEATSSIPVVMIASDPVVAGLVRSLDQPGANVTGVAFESSELGHQRLQFLRELVPGLSVVFVLRNAASTSSAAEFQAIDTTAQALRLVARPLDVTDFQGLQTLLPKARSEKAEAVLLPAEPWLLSDVQGVVGLMRKLRIPAVYPFREFGEAGGLVAYGPNLLGLYRRAGSYLGRVADGAQPQELPIDRPSRSELVVNVKTAKALGLSVPPSMLGRADHLPG